jgi:SSS family solute:Na+ symporter
MTSTGAIASMLTGFVVSSFWLVFVHFNEAKHLGIAKALFGTNSLLSGKIIFVDALMIALPASAAVAIVVSLVTRVDNEALKRSFG